MNDTILAIIEPDNYPETVAKRAAWLARRLGADLRLMMWSETSESLLGGLIVVKESKTLNEQIRDSELLMLESLRDEVTDGQLRITTSYRNDRKLVDCIESEVEELQPRYVLKGMHYHRPAERASMSDTDWRLIRKLSAPLWFVKPRGFADTPVIAAAVDPTHEHDKPAGLDNMIIGEARRIGDENASPLMLVHAFQTLSEIGARATWAVKPERLPIDDVDDSIRREHHRLVAELAERNNIDAKHVHELPGRPYEVLPGFCRNHGVDLLVMGAVARSNIKARVIGNTAQKTLDHVNCDLLIVHPDVIRRSGRRAA